jgi:predicted PurR-regulated permease PerM
MYPICKWLEMHGIHKSVAITTCILIVTIVFAALLMLLVWQLRVFSKDAPTILERLSELAIGLQQWLVENVRTDFKIQNSWGESLGSTIAAFFKSTVQTAADTLFMLLLTPVYAALFMYHRNLFVRSLKLITPGKYKDRIDRILHQTIHTYFNYIKGMLLVYLIVGILNSIGLLALGVDHAILFGMLCAIMTIIPYVGIVVSALLPISVVWLETGNILYPLGVIAVFALVQYLEANVIFPKVVGAQLNLSTLATLVAVIVGGIVWGVAGMVLFIPFAAILKIISDNIEEWKPINLLLSRK